MWQDRVVAHNVDSVKRSKDVILSELVTFDELLLTKPILSGLKKSGFNIPSPIQLKSIPLGRCGLGKISILENCLVDTLRFDKFNPIFFVFYFRC